MITEWGAAEEALLKALVEQGLNDTEVIARFREAHIERSAKAIERKRERMGLHAQVQVSACAPIDEPLTIEGDVLLTFDWHCPYHHAPWLNRVASLALKWGVKKAGIGGDAPDLNAFSIYGRNLGVEAEDEIRATAQALNAYADCFEDVVYGPGNHERRLLRQLGYLLGIERVMTLWVARKNVRVTRRGWFIVKSGGQTFIVGHPKNFSRNATYTAKAIARKRKAHVILGHDHLIGQTMDDSGAFWAIDAGMCADVKRLAYVQDELTTLPEMVMGAVIVKDGVPILLNMMNIAFYEGLS